MVDKKILLFIAHTPSNNTRQLADAVMKGAQNEEIEQVIVVRKAPLDVIADDILTAKAIIIGTTENLGYMAGLTKDVFDRCYYPCLDQTQGMPFAFYIRAGHDGTGSRRALESITTGLRWRLAQPALICRGEFNDGFLKDCEALGLTMAASLDAGII